jgi:glycosyltransferase involved in cell wall biosynthesis
MADKINVLVLPSDKTGVGKFRSVDPHIVLQRLYPDDFHVDILYDFNANDINFWKKYQIVHFHRSIGQNYEQAVNLIKGLKSLGIVTIMDLDDYWLPTKEHPIHSLIVQNKINEKIVNNLKVADYVMTTTEMFANEIRKINKNVVVVPNSIDPSEPQFQYEKTESDLLRIGWLGGSSHLHDLMLLEGSFNKLRGDRHKFQTYLAGFDTRGAVTEINRDTGEQTQRAIKPHETVWYQYEKIMTDNYYGLDQNYVDFLMKFKEEPYPNMDNQQYVRVWTRPVNTYAANYKRFDVSLAPIKNHIFNRVKSQLKVIEAGFHKKALIASNIGPYTIDLKHCLDKGNFVSGGNAFLVDENKNHSDWSKYIKKLIDNPNLVTDLGESLYETVKDKYHINTTTKFRSEFYKSLVK